MNNNIKEFYTLGELRKKLAKVLNISVENEKELNKIINQSITDNHLMPFLEYKGQVSIPTNCMPFASFEITETILETLDANTHLNNDKNSTKPYKYSATLNSVKNLVKTFEHGYCTKTMGVEVYTHAIFRLSPLNISNTALGINIELGSDKPVAHIEKFIESPLGNNEYEFLGYLLHSADKTNIQRIKPNKIFKLIFSSSDIICLLDKIDYDKKKSEKTISSSNLIKKDNKNSSTNTRNQDYKIIAMMAIMLSDKSPKFKHRNKPNKEAIKKEIHNLVNELYIDKSHTYGLDAPHKRIGECLKEFSDYFYTDLDKITIVTSK